MIVQRQSVNQDGGMVMDNLSWRGKWQAGIQEMETGE